MEFGKMEQFNKEHNQNVLEEEKTEELNVDQDPSLGGILSKDQVFQHRKELSELINKASSSRREINHDKGNKANLEKEKEISKLKEEINGIIEDKKE